MRNFLKKYIRLYFPSIYTRIYRYRARHNVYDFDCLVTESSDIVIDGYPRSGNTFLYSYIKLYSNARNIAHHLHNFTQIIMGIKLQKHCVIVVRNPLDAIASYLIYSSTDGTIENQMDIDEFVFKYVIFHKVLLRYIKNKYIHIVPFDIIKKDDYNSINNLLESFGLDIDFAMRSDDEVKKDVFIDVDIINKKLHSGNKLRQHRPNDDKKKMKGMYVSLIKKSEYLVTAEFFYEKIMNELKI